MKKPIVGITMGDAAGIGPEITFKCLTSPEIYERCCPVVLGDAKIMELAGKVCGIEGIKLNRITRLSDAVFSHGILDVLDYDDIDMSRFEYGIVSEMCGRAAVGYTMEAGRMTMNGEIQALVSAPLNKESMRKTGFHYEGQTEILGKLTNSKNYGMILLLNQLKIFLYTTHMSLRHACNAVKKKKSC